MKKNLHPMNHQHLIKRSVVLKSRRTINNKIYKFQKIHKKLQRIKIYLNQWMKSKIKKEQVHQMSLRNERNKSVNNWNYIFPF